MKSHWVVVANHAIRFALIAIIVYLLYDFFAVFMPIALSILIALLLNPLVEGLCCLSLGRNIKMPRALAIVLVLTLFFSGILLLCILLFVPLIKEFNSLMKSFPILFEQLHYIGVRWTEQVELLHLPNDVKAFLKEFLTLGSTYIVDLITNMLQSVLKYATNLMAFFLMPILVYYFLKDGKKFSKNFIHLLPYIWQDKAVVIMHESAVVMSSYMRSIMIVGFISGVVIGSGTYVLGLEYPLVFAALAVLAEAVPIVGPILATIPALLFASLQSTEILVVVALFYFIYYQINDYIIIPKVAGTVLSMHPVIIIISILVGGKLAGALGMILAIPVVALLDVLIENIITPQQKNNNIL